MEKNSARKSYHWHRTIARAIISRLLLLIHATVAVAIAVEMKNDINMWAIPPCSLIMFIIEAYVTLGLKNTKEWEWFCPAFFVYLCTIVPCFWIQRLELSNHSPEMMRASVNKSTQNMDTFNGSSFDNTIPPVYFNNAVTEKMADSRYPTKPNDYISLPMVGTVLASTAMSVVEQSMMIAIIFGRWLLPRGAFSRGALSQLLLVYLSLYADIIDFSEMVKKNKDNTLRLCVLAVWSLSLAQFCFVAVSNKNVQQDKEERKRDKGEICSLLTVCMMHDGPFLVVRLIILVETGEINNTIIFFLCKNVLTIILLLYRILIECYCISEQSSIA